MFPYRAVMILILKRMNRPYSAQDYVGLIESVLTYVPDIAIGTDIIVGFPGEGEKEFLNSRNLLDSLPLSYIHIFPFSARPDTSGLHNGTIKFHVP